MEKYMTKKDKIVEVKMNAKILHALSFKTSAYSMIPTAAGIKKNAMLEVKNTATSSIHSFFTILVTIPITKRIMPNMEPGMKMLGRMIMRSFDTISPSM